MFKKMSVLMLVLALVFSSVMAVNAQSADQLTVYEVPVFLEHYYEVGNPSMGNVALKTSATVVEHKGRMTYLIDCKPMKFQQLDGQVTNMFVYDDTKDGARNEALIILHDNAEYNKTFSFSRLDLKEATVEVAIWVDVMDKISNNGEYKPGAGEQVAKLQFDWSKAKQVTSNLKGSDLTILVNRTEVLSDSAPFISNGRTMVPVRFISEALGLAIDWDGATRTVIIGTDNAMRLQIGADQITRADGSSIKLDAPAVIVEGRTMVPLRAIAELSGATVDWDGETKTVLITGK